jgi:3-hydroxyacyl-CoA dehydrogenase
MTRPLSRNYCSEAICDDGVRTCPVLIRTIAVIGATATGCAFAKAAALAGYETVLEDVSREMRDRGLSSIAESLGAAVQRGEFSKNESADALARLTSASTIEDAIRDADLIIEAVPEELEMKLELFTVFDKFAKPGAIFASTTATLSILDISDVTTCRERCIGMRFREAGNGLNILELVRTALTSEDTFDTCRDVARRLAKDVRVVPDAPSAS